MNDFGADGNQKLKTSNEIADNLYSPDNERVIMNLPEDYKKSQNEKTNEN